MGIESETCSDPENTVPAIELYHAAMAAEHRSRVEIDAYLKQVNAAIAATITREQLQRIAELEAEALLSDMPIGRLVAIKQNPNLQFVTEELYAFLGRNPSNYGTE